MFGQYGTGLLIALATTAVVAVLVAMGRAPNDKGRFALFIGALTSVLTGAVQVIQKAELLDMEWIFAVMLVLAGAIILLYAFFALARREHEVAGTFLGILSALLMSQAVSGMF